MNTASLRRPTRPIALCMLLAFSGCTWVKVNDAGARVTLRTAAEVASCERIGTANVKTTAKVLVSRDPRDVQTEVIALGRNQAGEMGANAIVPARPLEGGSQSFDMYRCP